MKTFKEFIEELNEAKKGKFEIHYSKDGVRGSDTGNSANELISLAKKKSLTEFSIFKNVSGFHSTTQDEYLVNWYDERGQSYWANRSIKEPELLKKRIESL